MNDAPKLWRDMTPEEKGALLLAHHEGKDVEAWSPHADIWYDANPTFRSDLAYRVKPKPSEPREWWIAPNPYHAQGFHVVSSDYPSAIKVREVQS